MTEGIPFEPKTSIDDLLSQSQVLSDEELRAVLAPYSGDGGGSSDVVLVLTDDPEDVEQISAYLIARGARARPISDRYAALDLLRSHRFEAFVIALSTLGVVPTQYLERVRELDSSPQLGFIVGGEEEVPTWIEEDGTLAQRPLDDRELGRLFPWLPEVTIAAMHSRDGSKSEPLERADPRLPTTNPERSIPRPGERPPDWLAAVRALLEARSAGRAIDDALRGWAEKDPACAGWGEVTDRQGELTVRTGGSDRNALLSALAAELTDHPEPPTLGASLGDFGCLPTRDAWLAFWWRTERGGKEWSRFAPLVPLVDQLQAPRSGSEPSGPAPRDRLLRQLDGRMHAVRRHGGTLALLLLETEDARAAVDLIDELAPKLRGEDAIEQEGTHVWCLLERADVTLFPSIGTRLEDLAARVALRAVGSLWRAGGASAEELVEYLELKVKTAAGPDPIEWVG